MERVLNTRLLSKIPKDSETPVPTRHKKSYSDKKSESSEKIKASRNRIGMMELIDHIGTVSEIDDGIYCNIDVGTAQNILSIARYLLATGGNSLPGITTWQYNHPLPYEDGISEDVYHDLFTQMGHDEFLKFTLRDKMFFEKLRRKNGGCIALLI
jgi:hypothetical protein